MKEVTIAQTKTELRTVVRRWLRAQDAADFAAQAERLRNALLVSPAWRGGRVVLATLPLSDEPDLTPLFPLAIAQGKRVALPAFNPRIGRYGAREVAAGATPFVQGPHGAMEPGDGCPWIDPEALDLVLTPGLAFDASGARLGRGGGWFDRLLGESGAVRCGVAFDGQIQPSVPVEPHDCRMDWLATPQGVWRCRR